MAVITGISDAELAAMQASAARFAGDAEVACIEDLRALTEPAGPEAAGRVSAQTDIYKSHSSRHFMFMPHLS